MLIGFAFKNFMSFYGENIFTVKSGADTKFRELNTIKTEYGELLKSALVFGANGSGKSNFVKAVNCMKDVVLADLNSQSRMIFNIDNFAFSESANNIPTFFEVEFIADGIVYDYGFEILNGEVIKEYLHKKTKRKTPVFTRSSPDFRDISLSADMDNVKELTKNTRRDNLFLYWANGGNNEMAMTVYRWFENIQILSESKDSMNATINYLKKETDSKNNILTFMQKADINIDDLYIEFFNDALYLRTKHCVYDKKWKLSGDIAMPFASESAGTRKLFEIAGPIVKALENGNVVFVDEIDSRLHPMLVRFLVMMFNSISKNPKNAQLICNTHDVLLLDEDIRRDQIYFTEKDECGVSKLYALSDFKGVRKESKLLKQYLLGVFGATPKLKDYFPVKFGDRG